MQPASPTPAGTDRPTTRDAASVAFTGVSFEWDWKPAADVDGAFFGEPPAARRYRVPGHPSPTGEGRPS